MRHGRKIRFFHYGTSIFLRKDDDVEANAGLWRCFLQLEFDLVPFVEEYVLVELFLFNHSFVLWFEEGQFLAFQISQVIKGHWLWIGKAGQADSTKVDSGLYLEPLGDESVQSCVFVFADHCGCSRKFKLVHFIPVLNQTLALSWHSRRIRTLIHYLWYPGPFTFLCQADWLEFFEELDEELGCLEVDHNLVFYVSARLPSFGNITFQETCRWLYNFIFFGQALFYAWVLQIWRV